MFTRIAFETFLAADWLLSLWPLYVAWAALAALLIYFTQVATVLALTGVGCFIASCLFLILPAAGFLGLFVALDHHRSKNQEKV